MKISKILEEKPFSFSFEVFPPNDDTKLPKLLSTTNKLHSLDPDFISVTYGALGGTKNNTFSIAKNIKDIQNMNAVTHLTCVNMTKAEAAQTLHSMRYFGIENILALRGDKGETDVPGDFRYASDLIRFIKETQPDVFSIGGACYPEGHIEARNRTEDILNLKMKCDSGLDYLLTQMFFDNEIFYDFMDRLTLAGIHTPVIAGVMPVLNAKQILKICKFSGATLPKKFVRIIEKFEHNPEALREAGIAYASEQIIDLISWGVRGVHLYTMNSFKTADQICGNIEFVRSSR
ncbi:MULTISPECIES: methylenetetrahydrofolate reductase [NAD(P)H] [unclassified Fusibacter]|uniref:methylenetetrahydrofolate reductase [NAD(P)H] n=1 Tax=unclassified Fusibacter TaxID=2624464 RepID=UPI001010EE66|nr:MULTISPECIES: methylenetetrahydrofolate reductase [NAD(P)H] [unclassified Fusibacter]MCK8058319.1 methylenetetrahydrofolate reductase [NAD(P)H] [Fusibacter sp. A2]NPE20902.1 methylenetetrahydrofolate reductase [NAD(P)H] [Fusibacter sp. A1]RXV63106.1 methylenetetrahydrofolate reductase [NAD(P)H] [Fusibacter sp. A1]